MSRIEFMTELHDGTIEIPQEHRGHLHGRVRVIIEPEQALDEPDIIEQLLRNPLKVKDATPLTRDEAHERR